ncbi:hypothetical protein [Pyrococcus sp. ST04]|uniref:hypothetical protein n=1 Tax=Pyrococcus sp. ST04 TaxID=1183377 RepID=UPI0002605A8D|nr:hypothetical protein [Pyrococcus sp. ST04]AFK22078.1 hypothetical protein Py04_0476 [Pyrococcus sp. ST04]
MEVVSFGIPYDLKKKMKEVDINWNEEVRKLIGAKVREYRRKKALGRLMQCLRTPLPNSIPHGKGFQSY